MSPILSCRKWEITERYCQWHHQVCVSGRPPLWEFKKRTGDREGGEWERCYWRKETREETKTTKQIKGLTCVSGNKVERTIHNFRAILEKKIFKTWWLEVGRKNRVTRLGTAKVNPFKYFSHKTNTYDTHLRTLFFKSYEKL